jgi:Mg-chelatase subunit ChlD
MAPVCRLLLMMLVAFQARPDFRADVKVVRVDAEVSEGGRLIDGLTKDDFRLRDEGKVREIVYFGHAEEPLDVILVFDTSASMLPAIERVADVSRAALGALRAGDRVAVMAFDADTDLIEDFTSDLDRVQAVIQNEVLRRTLVPNSQIQPAAHDAARHFLRQPRTNRRRAVLFITDNVGSSRDGRALPAFWEADAVLSGLIVEGMAVRRRLLFLPVWLPPSGIEGITEIAEKTGGDALKVGDPGSGFRQMIQRLRLRYSLHYEMPQAKPGQERSIKVELSPDARRRYRGASIRARSGYVVPET